METEDIIGQEETTISSVREINIENLTKNNIGRTDFESSDQQNNLQYNIASNKIELSKTISGLGNNKGVNKDGEFMEYLFIGNRNLEKYQKNTKNKTKI